MSAVGLESIERTVELTHRWINDLDARLGWENKHRSFRLLRTVLQALRDWLSVNVAANFGAQLPELLRGIYYEHWRPIATPVKERHKADFIARVDKAFKADPILFTSEAVTTVFEEARRAVSDALPLLHKVEEVAVVELIEDEAVRIAAHRRVDDVVSWLGRHGIAAFSRVFHFPEQKDPFEKLWQYGVNFIVAGAFGHSRLRERVFGGFTDDLLRRSPLCTLFSH